MLRFNFIVGLNLTFILFNYYHAPKHGEITFEPSKKLRYSIYTIKIERLLSFKQIKINSTKRRRLSSNKEFYNMYLCTGV